MYEIASCLAMTIANDYICNTMKTSYKIGFTILALVVALFFAGLGLAIVSSSHNVNHEGGANLFKVSLTLGALGIIAVWLPWKKWLNKKAL